MFVYYKMTSLGVDAYVGTLNYKTLKQDGTKHPQTVVLQGHMENLGQAGSGYTYMEWVSIPSTTNIIPAVVIPYDCKIVKITVVYMADTPIRFTAPTDIITFDIGKITDGTALPPTLTNWNSYTGTTGFLTWSNIVNDNTYPRTIAETDIDITAGDCVGVLARESGAINPTTQEIQFLFEIEV